MRNYNDTKEAAKKIVDAMNLVGGNLSDAVYTLLRMERIKADTLMWMMEQQNGIEGAVREDIAEMVALWWCEDGDYDCNLSYWENIEVLVNRAASQAA